MEGGALAMGMEKERVGKEQGGKVGEEQEGGVKGLGVQVKQGLSDEQ